MLPAGFEPEIPAIERPQTDALDLAAAGTGSVLFNEYEPHFSSGINRPVCKPPHHFLQSPHGEVLN
jgi:hypothetical protein